MISFLERTFYGNSVQDWLLALLAAIVVMVVFQVVRRVIVGRVTSLARGTDTDVDDFVAHLLNKTHVLFLLIVALYAGSLFLTLPDVVARYVNHVAVIALFVQAGIWANATISFWATDYKREKIEEDANTVTVITALSFVGSIVVWALVLLLTLDNLGFDVTSLIAGLGIGGVAVALAVQNILGDLFASLSIVLDKPFVIGDFIIVGDYLGTVESIGLKSTRLRSLYGEELVFSNSDLLQSRIQNYKSLNERRVTFSIGVVYETPPEKLAAIPEMIRDIIEMQGQTRFDRAHFKEYGDFSLNFEIVYYVLAPDYNLYMDIQQTINLEIFRRFQDEGIEFAYPTQTLFVNRETAAPSVN